MAKRGNRVTSEFEGRKQDTMHKEVVYTHVYNHLLKGATAKNVIEALRNDDYGVGKKYGRDRAQEIYHEVRREILENFQEERKAISEMLYERYLDVYAEAREVSDRLSAISALKEIAKLTGANAAQKVEVNGTISGDIEIKFNLDNNDPQV